MNIVRRAGVQFIFSVFLVANVGVAQDAPPSELRTKPTLSEERPIPSARRVSRRPGGPQRTITAADVTKVIAVAKDVSPEWAAQLSVLHEEDPDALLSNIRRSGRRLLGLAMLRDRDPGLYTVRVGELRCKRELATAGSAYREAVRDGRTEDAATLKEVKMFL